jgi:hypothetical protein
LLLSPHLVLPRIALLPCLVASSRYFITTLHTPSLPHCPCHLVTLVASSPCRPCCLIVASFHCRFITLVTSLLCCPQHCHATSLLRCYLVCPTLLGQGTF